MAINADRILKATTNLYKGVTNPADLTFLVLTNGVPPDGTHLGAIGPISPSPGMEMVDKECENVTNILGSSITSNTLEIEVALKEWNATAIAWLTGAQRSGAGMFGGNRTTPEYDSLTIVWTLDALTGLYGFFHVYSCYVSSPSPVSPTKDEFAEFSGTLTAVADTTRDVNDRLWQSQLPPGWETWS